MSIKNNEMQIVLTSLRKYIDNVGSDIRIPDIMFRRSLNETWFSDTLAWLLDPKSDDSLGVKFLEQFTEIIARKRSNSDLSYRQKLSHLKFGKSGTGRTVTGSNRFSFKNAREQHSMIYRVGFTVDIKKGDYDRLVSDGLRLLKRRRSRKEGLKMLISALSMGLTDPDADRLLWNIAKGFYLIGDQKNSRYYYAKLYHFHPDSIYSRRIKDL